MNLARRIHRTCHRAYRLLAPPDLSQTRTAVLAHVFYHDLWNELAGHVANLRPLPFDLYVNLVEGNPANRRLEEAIRDRFPGVRVQVSENRGRDIGGFLRLLPAVLASSRRYDGLILMHSKKSVDQAAGYGDQWRASLLGSLLGRPGRAAEVARAFLTDPYLGIAAAHRFVFSAANVGELAYVRNQRYIDEYLRRFGLRVRRTDFVAGTMFWARAEPFLRVFAAHDPAALAAELAAGDHTDLGGATRTHALERVFSYIITAQGYEIRGLPDLDGRQAA
jgi:lipopolysaccharide biosynthesis protein